MVYTHHPRSRFERIMHRRRERIMHRRRERITRQTRQRKQIFPPLKRPAGADRRTARRVARQCWRYAVVHHLAFGPTLVD